MALNILFRGFAFSAALALAAPAVIVSVPGTAVAEEKKGKKGGDNANGTGIEWEVAPVGVEIHLDGKKLGTAGEIKFTPAPPGKHTIRLVNGKDETEMEVVLKKGEKLKFAFTFDEG